jgi:hypothetical protein
VIGVTIGLFEEDVPMMCANCGEEMDQKALILQVGESLSPIELLCDKCREAAELSR